MLKVLILNLRQLKTNKCNTQKKQKGTITETNLP